MQQHQLKPKKGSRHRHTRLGIGDTFAGRGSKGQQARTGKSKFVRAGFEGGQTPLFRRSPKLGGFRNVTRIAYQAVNIGDLEALTGKITSEVLKKAGLIRYADKPVKILAVGALTKKLDIVAHAISATAKAAVEKAGGSITLLAAKRDIPEKKPYVKTK